ncbi:type IV pilin-like G/H family protein [Leptolyngbya sp. FACHB-321]|uniref:type IV pilin-like G/H family protein n=1 Tax=Leptolyngbya sp. FACHB-321 TaxID=2692807 RepID=UPI001686F280|nr:type IV pilin-like G/H family protein [Leptolyngbya sp. FACHB-321]MBD2037403.1 type IV pilin-like G/H family protein [Leptolyngbya sp. FACHB-321]
MKSEFKAKFLSHLIQKKEAQGFTLIELLVVIIIIGILSAIALPSFLNQANKAKQSEAKTYVGSMNRAQQAYYLEKNAFAAQTDFGNLGLGVATQTTNYKYGITGGGGTSSQVTNWADTVLPKAPLKTYAGGVAVGTVAATSEATTLATLCEANAAAVNSGAQGSAAGLGFTSTAAPTCGGSFTTLN